MIVRKLVYFGSAALMLICLESLAQNADAGEYAVSCSQSAAMQRMVEAKSPAALTRASQGAPSTYKARLIYAARWFQFRPHDHDAATAFLNLLPKSDLDASEWDTFGDPLCEHISVDQMKRLDAFGSKLMRVAAAAALVAPEKMDAYVAAAGFATGSPHGDYAEQMVRVCRRRPTDFVIAVDHLEPKQRAWFIQQVIDPVHCRALMHSEAN